MEKNTISQKVIAKIKSWEGYEGFDGVDINFRNQNPEIVKNKCHSTILMEAVERGDANIVRSLIQAGADVNAVNYGTQQTPLLFLPCYNLGVVKIATALIEAGADVNFIGKWEDEDEDEGFNTSFSSPLIDVLLKLGTSDKIDLVIRELVTLLLNSGADVNLSRKGGSPAICYIEPDSDHYISLLNELIEAGANVNASSGYVLQAAIAASNIEAIELLISSGAHTDIPSEIESPYHGKTPFMSFLDGSGSGNWLGDGDLSEDEEKIVFMKLYENIGNVNAQDKDGRNLLYYALDTNVMSDSHPLLAFDEILFNKSIEINIMDNDNNNTLMLLLLLLEENGDSIDGVNYDETYKIASLLIAGSDTEIKNSEGESAADIAQRIGKKEVQAFNNNSDGSGIDIAQLEGYKELQALINNSDGLINLENEFGQTPLFIACLQEQTKKVRWLINKGAYVNAKNKCRNIPRGIELQGTLIRTQEEEVNSKFYSALMASQNLDTVRALIQAGADLNQKDSDGNTALMLYEKDNWQEGANELIRAGADTSTPKKWFKLFT